MTSELFNQAATESQLVSTPPTPDQREKVGQTIQKIVKMIRDAAVGEDIWSSGR